MWDSLPNGCMDLHAPSRDASSVLRILVLRGGAGGDNLRGSIPVIPAIDDLSLVAGKDLSLRLWRDCRYKQRTIIMKQLHDGLLATTYPISHSPVFLGCPLELRVIPHPPSASLIKGDRPPWPVYITHPVSFHNCHLVPA